VDRGDGGTGLDHMPARTIDRRFFVLRMDARFHDFLSL
jgi:hypothetical protein